MLEYAVQTIKSRNVQYSTGRYSLNTDCSLLKTLIQLT